MKRTGRAFELDALRGLAIILMVLQHIIVDFRYLLGLDLFAFQEDKWFVYIMQPFIVGVFVLVSGISSQFSKSNLKRSIKLFAIALGLSLAMGIFSVVSQIEQYVFFNVLHLLAVGTLLYGLFCLWENKKIAKEEQEGQEQSKGNLRRLVFLLLMGALLIQWQKLTFVYSVTDYWLLPLGFLPVNHLGMADYLPILPWLGFFFIGVVIGRIAYQDRQSLFPAVPNAFLTFTRPFQWVGRHSLLIYLVHQPILLAILFGLRYLGVW